MRLKRRVEARPRGELCRPVREFCLYPESHMKSSQGFKLDHICVQIVFSLPPSSLCSIVNGLVPGSFHVFFHPSILSASHLVWNLALPQGPCFPSSPVHSDSSPTALSPSFINWKQSQPSCPFQLLPSTLVTSSPTYASWFLTVFPGISSMPP